MSDVIAAPAQARVPVRGGGTFPVRRIFCVGRNFADHAKEMGAPVPASKAERGQPVFFTKPADAIVIDGVVPYASATHDLHHEVELVVALGEGAKVFGYAVGLDLTRRDLQSAAKAKGLPWDIGKAFDHSAPIGEIAPAALVGELAPRTLSLMVNGTQRQHSTLDQLIWDVPDILAELSKLFELKAGDLVFMGTPAGVSALQVGDRFEARLDDVLHLAGTIAPPRPAR
ncbi:fumarylacetoacetate hydrolase family protein [Lysobacter sp. KIS68-7]|uniref:fumarylacetoacetate hydrolase family protein n=1 Tax=Lysobacter sp. KIS68-7 TaxID=2904252 RepID=UPI001E468A05|nr:fumarylacetoacetate hydrolase family protein [Lysobacter sp. KIS68-7]UHQ19798.1 fumarylacetoacetate hydrolase family protein [Lysobacter sp. KIS68-7]